MSSKLDRRAFGASLAYWLITISWVLVTDELIIFKLTSLREIDLIGIYRIAAFATVSAALLYLLIVRQTGRFRKEAAEHAAAEKALRKSELHLKAAQSLAHIGSWEWDPVNRTMSWSDEMFAIFRVSPEGFKGSPETLARRIHPDDLERFNETVKASLENGRPLGQPIEFRIVVPGGEIRTLSFLDQPRQGQNQHDERLIGIVQDITEMRRQEAALRESEGLLRRAEMLAHLGHGSWDPETGSTTWSEEMYRIAGRDTSLPPPGFCEGASVYTPDSRSRLDAAFRNAMKTGQPYDLEVQVKRPDGGLRDVRVRGEADRDKDGRITRMVSTMQDITEQKRAELALRESEDRYRSLFENSYDAILLTAPDGQILAANTEACLMFGRTEDELRRMGRGVTLDLSDTRTLDAIQIRERTGRFRGELTLVRKDGEKFSAEVSSSVFVDRDGNRKTSMVIRDITERIRNEQALKFSMEQLHDLTARLESVREEERKSISHEVHDQLGQILTAVKMDILSLQAEVHPGDTRMDGRISSAVSLVDEAMKTARDVSARLRPGVLDYLGLVPAVEWEVERFQIRYGIQSRLYLPHPEPGFSEAQSTVLYRILQEALTNVARHSKADTVEISLFERQDEYVMGVADNGVGIRQEQVDDPRSFGLMSIRERLHPLGGRCVIRQRRVAGTEVIVNLPKVQKRENYQ